MKIAPSSPKEFSQSTGKSQQSISKEPSANTGLIQRIFQAGETVKGQVVAVDAQGVLTIETAAGRFSAKSLMVSLAVGDQIFFEVLKAGDDLLVNIAPEKSQPTSQKQSPGAVGIDRVGIQSGDLVKAKVVSVDPLRVLTIEPVNSRPSAELPTAVSVGDQIILRVGRADKNLPENSGLGKSLQLETKPASDVIVGTKQTEVQIGDTFKGNVIFVDSKGQVTIDSAVGRFLTEPTMILTVGDKVVLEVSKAGAAPLVNVVPDKPGQLNPQQDSESIVGYSQAEIQAGDVVKGEVVAVDTKGVVTIETVTGRVSAKSAIASLSVGDQILFEVIKASLLVDHARDGLAQGKGQVFDILRVLMPWLKPGNVVNLQEIFGTFQSGLQENQSEGQLLQFLTDNTVGDVSDPVKQLKMASLVSSLKDGRHSNTKVLQSIEANFDVKNLETEVSHSELKKILHLLGEHAAFNDKDTHVAPQGPTQQLSDLWLFPCFFANGTGAGEWLFSFEQTGVDEQEKDCSVAFYLTMSKLGDVHLQLSFRKSVVNGVFSLESEAAMQHVQQFLPQLQETLAPLFGTVVFSCRTASEKLIERLKSDLQKKAGMAQFALIDVSA